MARAKRVTIPLTLDASGLRRGATQASSALRKFERDGTRSVRRVDSATDRLNRSFRSAARYAAGAAAAYISIDQARIAIETTQELGRATSNLANTFGLSNEMASSFAAVAKARNIEATTLTMTFKTLSTQVENFKDGSGEAADAFDKLGISLGDLKGLSMDETIGLIVKQIGELPASSNKAAIMSQLLGRGMSRLGFLFRDGSKGLQQYLDVAQETGVVLTDMESEKVKRLNFAMFRLKMAQMGLYQSFALALTPAIEKAADRLTGWIKVMNDPDLTLKQKVGQISREITGMVTKVLPQAITAMANQAPKVAGAFVQGFINAGIWGKLALGALLVSKLGGPRAWFGYGQMGGKAMGIGIAAGLVLAYPEIKKVIDSILKEVLPGPLEGLVDIANKIPNPFAGFRSANQVSGDIEKLRGRLLETAVATGKTKKGLKGVGETGTEAANKSREGFRKAYSSIAENAQSSMRKVNTAQDSVATKARSKASESRSVWSRLGDVFDTVRGKASSLWDTISGLISEIGSLPQKAFNAVFKQRGGAIPGTGTGDKIAAMLEPGEFVLNRNAVAAIGVQNLHAMNSAVPRFATGGYAVKGGKVRSLETDLAFAEFSTPSDLTDDQAAAQALYNYYANAAGTIRGRLVKRKGKDFYDRLGKAGLEKFGIKFSKGLKGKALQRRIEQGQNKVRSQERQDLLSALQSANSYRGQIDQYSEMSGANELLASQNALLSQQAADRQAMLNVSQSQYGVLIQALAAAVSGHIGGRVGLGRQTPSAAGRLAAY